MSERGIMVRALVCWLICVFSFVSWLFGSGRPSLMLAMFSAVVCSAYLCELDPIRAAARKIMGKTK